MVPPSERPCSQCAARPRDPERPRVGRPFDECALCGALVARPGREEWSVMAAPARLSLFGREAVWVLGLGLLPALVAALVGRVSGDPLALERLAAWALGGMAAVGAFRAWRLGEDLRASARRMGDPMYRARLAEFQMARAPERSQATADPRPPSP